MNKVLILGFGSIGQGLVPVMREFEIFKNYSVSAICAEGDTPFRKLQNKRSYEVAKALEIELEEVTVTKSNFEQVLAARLEKNDILVNVSVGVSSKALIQWCQAHEVLYIDTCVEPWEGEYQTHSISNYELREDALSLAEEGKSTAIIAHGANPGLVTHLLKAGLKELAKDKGITKEISCDSELAFLAKDLGIKTILIAERDTQTLGREIAEREFCNTWSVDGLISEAVYQHSEIGNGSHEDWNLEGLSATALGHEETTVLLSKPSAEVLIKSWTPSAGEQVAMAITHHENTSIAAFLTCEGYRPSVTYAYNPSEETWKSLNAYRGWTDKEEFTRTTFSGCNPEEFDELGLLFVYEGGSYWYGSTVTVEDSRQVAFNGPTTIQVTSAIAAALEWALANPNKGVVEPESMDSEFVLSGCKKYLGNVKGVHSDWQPGTEVNFKNFIL